MDAASQYALAYALTTTAGVRAIVALAGVAVAAHFGFFHPPGSFAWLASPAAMWVLVGVGALELIADKVPILDHAGHFIQVATKPAAAAILVGGSVHAQSTATLATLMVLGGLNALGVHAGIAALRGASTVTTGGVANPAVSTAEDVGTIGSLFVAFLAPFVAAFLAITFTVLLLVFARTAFRRLRAH